MPKTLITTTINPDLDDFASSYAYYKLLSSDSEDYDLSFYGKFQPDAQFVIDRFVIDDFQLNKLEKYDSYILLDDSNPEKIPNIVQKDLVKEIIDHHDIELARQHYPNANINIEQVGATATLVFGKYNEFRRDPSLLVARLLLASILTSTLNLQSNITTDKDRSAVDYLKNLYGLDEKLAFSVFDYKTAYIRSNLINTLRDDFKIVDINGIKIAITQLEVTGAEEIVEKNMQTIKQTNESLRKREGARFAFLVAVDIRQELTILVAEDAILVKMLQEKLNVTFAEERALIYDFLLRKEIVRRLGIKIL